VRGVAYAVCVLLLLPALNAVACEIPVYQYALENWESDEYEVFVFHRGELSAVEREAVGLLRAAEDGNVLVQTVDLATSRDSIMAQRWRDQGTAKLPWVAAYYPRVQRIREPAWAGPLEAAEMRALLDSPLRRKIAGELASRVTAAWILLESGDRGRDNAAAALLERELRRLEETLVLPVLEAWGPDAAAREPDPVRFTMHRLSRGSAAERMLVRMLLHSEPDLTTKFAREPLVFPIYGRGLILYALAGAGINEWTITKAAEFVTGPCSCQVKASNPGTDLLVALDWNAQVRQMARERMPPPAGMASFGERAAEAERRLAEVDAAQGGSPARAGDGAATPSANEAAGGQVRSTAPRTMGAAEAPAPRAATGASGPATQAPPSSGAESSAGEVAGPPAPDEQEPAGEPGPEDEPAPDPEAEDSAPQSAAVTQDDPGSDGGGVARLVGTLALIAGGITAALTAVAVMRRRRNAVRDEKHERVAT
jgi:hypothetical protein